MNTIPQPTDSQPERFLSTAEIAEMFGFSDRTIRRYIKSGRIKAYRMGPRAIRLDPHEVAAQLLADPMQADAEAS